VGWLTKYNIYHQISLAQPGMTTQKGLDTVATSNMASLPSKLSTLTRPAPQQVATIANSDQPLLALANLIFNTKTIPLDWAMAATQQTPKSFKLKPKIQNTSKWQHTGTSTRL